MKKIAIISAILENPADSQAEFNQIIAQSKAIVKGRLGLPFDEYDMSVISLNVIATMDEINSLTGKLGKIKNVMVKTAISQKEV